MKAQLKSADRMQARFAAILGEDELAKGEITLKDLSSSEQETVQLEQLTSRLQQALK